jgi:hypothetical protein
VRRLHIVQEPGGAEWVFVAPEPGPGVETVEFVEPGYGSTPSFVVSEMGPGTTRVYAAGGQGSGGPGVAPTASDVATLPGDEAELMSRLREQAASALASGDPDALAATVSAAMAVANHPWPEPVWTEEVARIGCLAAIALVERHGMMVEAAPAIGGFAQQFIDRDWLFGGPNGVLDSATAQRTLELSPVVREFVQAAAQPASVTPRSAEPQRRRRFWRR